MPSKIKGSLDKNNYFKEYNNQKPFDGEQSRKGERNFDRKS